MENRKSALLELSKKLGYQFKDIRLLEEALTHPSYRGTYRGEDVKNYQRLEFIGDRVVNILAAEKLFHYFPDAPEGRLAEYYSRLVGYQVLGRIARKLELGTYMRLGLGTAAEGLRDDDYALSCVLEAVLGAMFIDSGLGLFKAKDLLEELLFGDLEEILQEERRYFNPKGVLQALAMKRFNQDPQYKLIRMHRGSGHQETEVEVYVGGVSLARGVGDSSKDAEKKAALAALDATKDLRDVPLKLRQQLTLDEGLAVEPKDSATR